MARSERRQSGEGATAQIPPAVFRRRLAAWYKEHARALAWRQTTDPYRIWVSEIMLQQTRVGAVVEHYNRFVAQFPSVVALSLAPEDEVLAAWSGLGYYRRARMLHKAARFLVLERAGGLPGTAAELRTLPGIGDYTAAAIASIAFGESVAVVDGNVERVILRLTGSGDAAEGPIRGAAVRKLVREQAQALMPVQRTIEAAVKLAPSARAKRLQPTVWTAAERVTLAAAAYPELPAEEDLFRADAEPAYVPERVARSNPAGDHNQAMMELGAMICLPRAPLCPKCPVHSLCRTRGEHKVAERPKPLSRPAAFLLDTRKSGTAAEVLLERRPFTTSLMAGMLELPTLRPEQVEGHQPVLRLRHTITNTNYYVEIYAASPGRTGSGSAKLCRIVKEEDRELIWVKTSSLRTLPLTGLARKVLHRLKIMEGPAIELLR